MSKLKCAECGNTKNFYKNITVPAKLKVDSEGNESETIYDIEKEVGDWCSGIYCGECDEEIEIEY
jgi:hypothetical protein